MQIIHSIARIPPSEPPMTVANRSIPSRSASARSVSTWSRMEIAGNREPHALPSGAGEAGPVVPRQLPSALVTSTHHSSVSMGAPGPTMPAHQPGVM